MRPSLATLRLPGLLLATAALGCPAKPSPKTDGPAGGAETTAARQTGHSGYRPRAGDSPASEAHAVDVRVRFTGTRRAASWDIPPMVRSQCGGADKVADQALQVSGDGGVDDAVVWLDDIHEGAALPASTAVTEDEKGCVLGPHVLAMGVPGTLKLTNSDPANHAVRFEFANPPGDPPDGTRDESFDFTKTLPAGATYGVDTKADWAGRYARVSCPIHLWMWGYVHFFEHPYFAVTHAGVARLENVPPGNYHVRVWHEGIGVTFTSSLKFPPPETARAEVTVEHADAKVAFTMGEDGKMAPSPP